MLLVVASCLFVTVTFVGHQYSQPTNEIIAQDIKTKLGFLLEPEVEEIGESSKTVAGLAPSGS